MEYTDKNPMTVSPEMLAVLDETRKWSMFLAILGFIAIGFVVLASLFVGTFMYMDRHSMPFSPIYISFVYLLMAALYIIPVFYLYRFSTKLKDAIHGGTSADLTNAFLNLKSHYKFIGILCIAMVALYVLSIVIALFSGLMIF